MRIILTNDDGIQSQGIQALMKAVPEDAVVAVVAPASERSASSHSISLGQKLRVEQYEKNGSRHYAVHGTPADCVKFAVSELRDFAPDLIVSGINHGANTGVSVFYSGTISAAREGMINRIPSMAVSLCSKTYRDFSGSVHVTSRLISGYLSSAFPKDVLLNVNIPPLDPEQIKGMRITKQAASRFIEEFVTEKQHDGKKVYTLAGEIELYDQDGSSDEEAVNEGYVSITPLRLDMTDYEAMQSLKQWVEKS